MYIYMIYFYYVIYVIYLCYIHDILLFGYIY